MRRNVLHLHTRKPTNPVTRQRSGIGVCVVNIDPARGHPHPAVACLLVPHLTTLDIEWTALRYCTLNSDLNHEHFFSARLKTRSPFRSLIFSDSLVLDFMTLMTASAFHG